MLNVFEKVERHKFVNKLLRSQAYNDYPLPIEADQTISQPYIVALMTELLQLKGEERVLEIGLDLADAHYNVSLLLEPGSAKTYLELAGLWDKADQSERALACYRSAVEADPKLASARYYLGAYLVREEQTGEAA